MGRRVFAAAHSISVVQCCPMKSISSSRSICVAHDSRWRLPLFSHSHLARREMRATPASHSLYEIVLLSGAPGARRTQSARRVVVSVIHYRAKEPRLTSNASLLASFSLFRQESEARDKQTRRARLTPGHISAIVRRASRSL